MSLIRFNFQTNHENPSSGEPYYSPQSGQKNSNDTIYRGSHRSCSIKKMFLKILQNSQENTSVRVSFLINCRPEVCNFIEEETPVFFCEFSEIFKKPFFTKCLRETTSVFYGKKKNILFTPSWKEQSWFHILSCSYWKRLYKIWFWIFFGLKKIRCKTRKRYT